MKNNEALRKMAEAAYRAAYREETILGTKTWADRESLDFQPARIAAAQAEKLAAEIIANLPATNENLALHDKLIDTATYLRKILPQE